jgi:CRISPR-associated protein Csx14
MVLPQKLVRSNQKLAELKIQFDPCNAAQFYACCGLIELAEIAGQPTCSKFVVDNKQPRRAEFILKTKTELDLQAVVESLRQAEFCPFDGDGSGKPPGKDSIAPVSVIIFGKKFVLDWWLDDFHAKAKSLKCWAGQVTTQKLFSELPKLLPKENSSFTTTAFTSTRFGIDPSSAWVALDLGYSPNEQGQESQTYPLVELLAAFGLQGFRPSGSRADGFTYHLWSAFLPCAPARLACAKPWSGLRTTGYKFSLGERGSYKVFCFSEQISS